MSDRANQIEDARSVASAALTCRMHNTPEWMEYMAERINAMCESFGDDERYEFDGKDTFRLRKQ